MYRKGDYMARTKNQTQEKKTRKPVGQRDDRLSARERSELSKYFDTMVSTSYADIRAAYKDSKLCDEWN